MPNIDAKKSKVDEIKQNLEGASSIVLVDYRGLTVEEDTQLRKSLREANVTYKVFKNTMMNFAFDGTEYESLKEYLAGPSAVAISYEDPTAGPRVLAKSAKDYQELEFKAGVVEGKFYDVDGITKIAKIPPREELLGKLLGSFKSPVSTFARTMKALADKATEAGVETIGEVKAEEKAEETQE